MARDAASAPPPGPIEGLATRFRSRVARSRRQLAVALVFLGLVSAALVGRSGTGATRLAGSALLLGAISALVFVVMHARRTLLDRRRLIAATLAKAAPAAGARALRALSLVEESSASARAGESPYLAHLHFQRVLALTPAETLDRWAVRTSERARLLLLLTVVVAGTALALDPSRVLEGLDVLAARGGRAPVPMFWLGSLRVESEPPAYLRSPERSLFPSGVAHEAAGSVIVFQGVPEREGRHLVLLGGDREVPFVSDGAGGMLARWVLTSPVELRVAARFGEVLIVEPDGLELRPVPDEAPRAELEGAPKRLLLKDLQALELRYSVSDDNGLREVALVLRAGGREDRRTLERLDGETRKHTGAQALSPRDGFLRRAFLPVEVSIEARDNDGVSGAKWGSSAAITLLPPGIGEGEALRYAALAAARDALVGVYAGTLRDGDAASKDAKPRPTQAVSRELQAQAASALASLRSFADASYAGLAVPKTLKTFLLGQARAVERPAATRETFLRRLEDVTLAVDAALRATGDHDAEGVAKRLGDVAEEVADASKLGQDPEKLKAATRRLEIAVPVLHEGAAALVTLSHLGADLGSVAQGELRRIQRGLAAKSYVEAELAARHLAARLRRPKPSFSSADSGGVESGGQGGRGGSQQPGEASQAHQQFQDLMRELQQLSAEHAGEISAVENALKSAEEAQQAPELEREAKERAEALRRALEGLPDYAPGQTPAEQAAALAREHGRAMAESLSRLSLKDAKQSGDSARQQLGVARQAAGAAAAPPDAVARAEQELLKQQAFVEELLKKAQEAADARAKDALERSGKREHELAERAQNLSGRGSHGEAALPGEVAEALDKAEGLMREAARALESGRGDQGLSLQRDAQRWLDLEDDEAKSPEDQKPDEPKDQKDQKDPKDSKDAPDGRGVDQHAEVPGRDKSARAEEFRKRVLEGSSQSQGGRLGPAMKRYLEGLLK